MQLSARQGAKELSHGRSCSPPRDRPHVPELPSTENISPHYSLDKLYNRFFYDLKALAAESADPLWDHPC